MLEGLQNKASILLKRWSRKLGLDLTYFIKSGFWMTIRQIIGICTGLLLSVAFARLLPKEMFGQYQFIISIISMISIVSLPGINTAIIQSVARGYEGSYIKAVRVRFLWSWLGLLILLVVGGYYYLYESQTLGLALMISGIFFPFFYALNTWDAFLQGKERFDLSTKFVSIQSIINTLFVVGVIFFLRDNLILIVAIYLAVYSFFNILWFWRSLKYIENNKTDQGTISYGFFLTKINALGMIANNIDRVLIGTLLGPEKLAIYYIGTFITIKIQETTKAILGITSPKMAKTNIFKLKYKNKIFFSIFAACIIISILVYLLIPFIIKTLYTEFYDKSIIISQIVVIFYPFFIIRILYKNYFLLYLKARNVLFLESTIFPILKIVLKILSVKFGGIIGLAIIVGFQHIIDIVVLWFLSRFFWRKQ